jgi:anti-anti-sigma factor
MAAQKRPPATWRFEVTDPVVTGDQVLLRLAGRLGHRAAPTLTRVGKTVVGGGCRRLVLDLAGVDYVSGVGTTALRELARELERNGGDLVLTHVSDPVRVVLELAALDSCIERR